MKSYRERIEIMAEILRVASESAKKTRIMYQSNLSYKVLQKYLSEAIEAGLLKFVSETQSYITTEKGQKFLETFTSFARRNKRIQDIIDELDKKKKTLNELCPKSSAGLSISA